MSIQQIIFKGTVVFVLRKRSGVAGQATSVSAAEVADGRCDVGQDTETVSNLKLERTLCCSQGSMGAHPNTLQAQALWIPGWMRSEDTTFSPSLCSGSGQGAPMDPGDEK